MLKFPDQKSDAPARDESEHLEQLLRVSAPHERIVLAGAGLVILAFVVWVFLGSVARTVTADGVLIAPGEHRMAVSAEPGQLLEHLVAPGDQVTAGQAVARQSVPGLDQEASVLGQKLNLLQTELGHTESTALRKLLDVTQMALLGIETRRTARQTIVSPGKGEVMAMLSDPGAFLQAGAAVAVIRVDTDGPPRAALHVDQDTARRLRPGMPASVEIRAPDGDTRWLNGKVAGLAAGRESVWLARLMPTAPPSWNRVDIVLDQTPDFPVSDGMAGRIRIELDLRSPASLLFPGRS